MSFNNFPQKGQLAIATINTSVKGSLTLFNLAMKVYIWSQKNHPIGHKQNLRLFFIEKRLQN